MSKVTTGVKKTILGHQVWFTIDNQTFNLEISYSNKEMTSKKKAEWYNEQLIKAFNKLDGIDVN